MRPLPGLERQAWVSVSTSSSCLQLHGPVIKEKILLKFENVLRALTAPAPRLVLGLAGSSFVERWCFCLTGADGASGERRRFCLTGVDAGGSHTKLVTIGDWRKGQ